MTKQTEALKSALEAMESFQSRTNGLYKGEFQEEINAIKEALSEERVAQPEQELTKLWCETCEGTGQVHQEYQKGCHVGGDFECPDCDGKGYIVSRLHSITPPQPEQEFVEWRYALTVEGTEVAVRYDHANWNMKYEPFGRHGIDHGGTVTRKPVYTAPPQRTWIGLTNEEIEKTHQQYGGNIKKMMRAVEAKLKEKNT